MCSHCDWLLYPAFPRFPRERRARIEKVDRPTNAFLMRSMNITTAGDDHAKDMELVFSVSPDEARDPLPLLEQSIGPGGARDHRSACVREDDLCREQWWLDTLCSCGRRRSDSSRATHGKTAQYTKCVFPLTYASFSRDTSFQDTLVPTSMTPTAHSRITFSWFCTDRTRAESLPRSRVSPAMTPHSPSSFLDHLLPADYFLVDVFFEFCRHSASKRSPSAA